MKQGNIRDSEKTAAAAMYDKARAVYDDLIKKSIEK